MLALLKMLVLALLRMLVLPMLVLRLLLTLMPAQEQQPTRPLLSELQQRQLKLRHQARQKGVQDNLK